MGTIFTNQTYLRIQLNTGVDITGSTTREIHYIKPDGTTGTLTANVLTMNPGVLYYDVPPASTLLDQSGSWKFHTYIVFVDGRFARGETYKEKIVLETT